MTDLVVSNLIPGLESIDSEDIRLPRIGVDCKNGLFKLPGKVEKKEIETVMLALKKGRVCWGTDDKPECKSYDRITGTKFGKCEPCDKKEWDGDEKPKCKETYEFLIFSDNQSIPYALTIATPTSLGSAKNYITMFVAQHKPLFSAVTKLSFEKKAGKTGSYFVVTFENIGEVENQERYLKMMSQYRGKEVEEVDAKDDFFNQAEDLLGK